MRRRALILVVWLLLTTSAASHDEEGGVTDESLVTYAWILGGLAFVGFVTFKVVPWIRNLDLNVPGLG